MDTITVEYAYLKSLLEAPSPNQEELNKYFYLKNKDPFNLQLELRESVKVVDEEGIKNLGIKDSILNLLNWNARKGRKKRYDRMINLHQSLPRIVSEGDSWFLHPMVEDTIDHLQRWFPVYCVSAAGDTLRNMHRNPKALLNALKDVSPSILLLSAGGNDILGDPQFVGFLNSFSEGYSPGEHPERFMNQSFFDEIKNLTNLYRSLCQTIPKRQEGIQIIVHGYDYIIPNNPNVPNKLYQAQDKSWLGNPMISNGITNQLDKQAIINYIIDLFNDILKDLSNEFNYVHYLDLRGTVKKWEDEIHPSKDGYEDISVKIQQCINQIV